MVRRWCVLVVAGAFCIGKSGAAVDLTATELTWLEAAVPVLSFARQAQLPLDIIVQPRLAPGESPMGMAFIDGRCKLVLSMRGNAEAQSTLDSMPRDLVGPIVETLAAHELGHCWRHLHNHWGTLPGGMRAAAPPAGRLTAEQVALLTDMWRQRREEAYADLVGLAWAQRHHRARFDAIHAWYVRLRADQAVDTGPHDTRLWVHLARDPARFAVAASIFEQAESLWKAGLLAQD